MSKRYLIKTLEKFKTLEKNLLLQLEDLNKFIKKMKEGVIELTDSIQKSIKEYEEDKNRQYLKKLIKDGQKHIVEYNEWIEDANKDKKRMENTIQDIQKSIVEIEQEIIKEQQNQEIEERQNQKIATELPKLFSEITSKL